MTPKAFSEENEKIKGCLMTDSLVLFCVVFEMNTFKTCASHGSHDTFEYFGN